MAGNVRERFLDDPVARRRNDLRYRPTGIVDFELDGNASGSQRLDQRGYLSETRRCSHDRCRTVLASELGELGPELLESLVADAPDRGHSSLSLIRATPQQVFSHSRLKAYDCEAVPDHIVDITSNSEPILGCLAPPLLFLAARLVPLAGLDLGLKTAPDADAAGKQAGCRQPNDHKDEDPRDPS